MFTEIDRCRICGNCELAPIINLGSQYLTGVFPRSKDEEIGQGPLELVKCHGGDLDKTCGLVQLKHSFLPDQMYGDNYGYRSGLNQSMVAHLQGLVKRNELMIKPKAGDLIVDIGSNDGTLLAAYGDKKYLLVKVIPIVKTKNWVVFGE